MRGMTREKQKRNFKVRNNGHLIQYGIDSNALELNIDNAQYKGHSRGTFQLDRPGNINVRSTKILNVRISNRTDNLKKLNLYAGFMKKANHPDNEIKVDSGLGYCVQRTEWNNLVNGKWVEHKDKISNFENVTEFGKSTQIT